MCEIMRDETSHVRNLPLILKEAKSVWGKTCHIRFHHVAQQVLHTFFLGVSQFVEVVSESVPFTPGGSCTRSKVEWLQLTGRCRRTIHLIIYKREQNYIDRSQEKK